MAPPAGFNRQDRIRHSCSRSCCWSRPPLATASGPRAPSTAWPSRARARPRPTIPRIEAAADARPVDGALDEPVWQQATRLTGFWQYQPVDGRPAEEATEVLVWYAPDAI